MKTTLEMSGEDEKLHSKRVKNITFCNYDCCVPVLTTNWIEKWRFVADTHIEGSHGWRKLTVVLNYYKAMETYSRIELLQSYGNLQSY